MKKISLWIIPFLSYFCFIGFAFNISHKENKILSILNLQKKAWNDRNLEGFMEYYWKSEEFTFQSGNSRLHGWQELLSRYEKSYSGENWGILDFTDIMIKVLSGDSAFVLGRWKVTLDDTSKEGVFTLILKKFPEGWKIIHDHTS